jgi:hypothetical protein
MGGHMASVRRSSGSIIWLWSSRPWSICRCFPAAEGDTHAYRNRADDEQDAHELAARRVIDPPGYDSGDAEGDGKDHNEVLNGLSPI